MFPLQPSWAAEAACVFTITVVVRLLASPSRIQAAVAAGLSAIPLAKPAAFKSATLFTRLDDPKGTGIDLVSPVDLEHKKSFLYHSGTATGGLAIGDVDGDG